MYDVVVLYVPHCECACDGGGVVFCNRCIGHGGKLLPVNFGGGLSNSVYVYVVVCDEVFNDGAHVVVAGDAFFFFLITLRSCGATRTWTASWPLPLV